MLAHHVVDASMLTPDMRAVLDAARLGYEEALRRAYGDGPRIYPTTSVVLLAIEHAAPLLSPAYWAGADEAALRATWKERRAELDRAFDAYLSAAAELER